MTVNSEQNKGLVVTTFGSQVEVEDDAGKIIRCHLRKNMTTAITGDKVLWQQEDTDCGVITEVLPRSSILEKPDHRGKTKAVAANVDCIFVVTALPKIFEYLIDRYLLTAHFLKIPAAIVINKMDLHSEADDAHILELSLIYEKLGYPVIKASTKLANGLDSLQSFLINKTSVLVGASGVGKSSIIATFLPQEKVMIGETGKLGLGKHTTTTTHLYHLPTGGDVIDSPGVREFGLWNMSPADILAGFTEFKPYLGDCKFRNCSHIKEIGCAIKEAVSKGDINEKRYQSYCSLLDK